MFLCFDVIVDPAEVITTKNDQNFIKSKVFL
jgi:hypothetical protein